MYELAEVLKNKMAELSKVAQVPETDSKPEKAPEIKDSPTPNDQPDAAKEQVTGFLSQKCTALLSTQLGNEIFSAYAYFTIAGWFKNKGLDGFMKWAQGQGNGELDHYRKIYDYLLESGQEFNVPAIDAPTSKFSSVKDAVQEVLKLEKAVTNDWRKIHSTAIKDEDAATTALAQWFVTEQMEEEDVAFTLLQRVNMADDNGLLVIDCSLMK